MAATADLTNRQPGGGSPTNRAPIMFAFRGSG
jgi:hypothetical protein